MGELTLERFREIQDKIKRESFGVERRNGGRRCQVGQWLGLKESGISVLWGQLPKFLALDIRAAFLSQACREFVQLGLFKVY
jgi:hypothetical protein